MKQFLKVFDLYKKPITLPIKSQSKYSNLTGLIVSLITYIAFSFHFYLESYEAFAREHPNVVTNKNNIRVSKKPSLKLSNETLLFFLNINEYLYEGDLLSHFELNSHFRTLGREKQQGNVKFTNCTSEDILILSEYVNFDKMSGVKLCPRINFSIPVDSFYDFWWEFSIRECKDDTKGCTRDEDLYKGLREGEYTLFNHLYFINYHENMLNAAFPFYSIIEGYYAVKSKVLLKLKGIEVTTQSLLGFTETESRLQVFEHTERMNRDPEEFYSLSITFDPLKDLVLHRRTYKLLTWAFSNVYSLFKFYSWVLSIFLNNHYLYNINKIIINKNFDYGGSINSSNEYIKRKSVQNRVNEINSNQQEFLKEFKVDKNKSNQLTLPLIYRKVSCCRLFFCNRKNLTKRFYDSSMRIIKKHLSVEQLWLYLVETTRLRNCLEDKLDLRNLDEKERLVLDLTMEGGNQNLNMIDILNENDDYKKSYKNANQSELILK
jgi:hypothetical protein